MVEVEMRGVASIVGYCGVSCDGCPVFVATQTGDNAKRKETAALLAKEYGLAVKLEGINCDGCTSEGGKIFEGCHTCEIRKCGQARGIQNCGYCEEYVCERLASFPEFTASCRATLDGIEGHRLG